MAANNAQNATNIPTRAYGRDGVQLSVIGFGGILVMNEEQSAADRLVARAFDAGINYFDVAPSYGDAELRLGPALRPYRDRVFLACKTTERTAAGARDNLNHSLEHLHTDHFDLYQLHALQDLEADVDAAFAKGGAMEVLREARDAGVIRYLGFSAHNEACAVAAMDRFDFDSVLFPVNFASWQTGGFGPRIMERAQQAGVSRLALKAMACQQWREGDDRRENFDKCWYEPITERRLADLALRWTLSQPITAAIPPGTRQFFDWALETVQNLQPLSPAEQEELHAAAEALNPIFPLPTA